VLACLLTSTKTMAQNEKAKSDTIQPGRTADTIRVGGIVIVTNRGDDDQDKGSRKKGGNVDVRIFNRKRNYNSNISTNWWIIDLGFNNFRDETDYAAATSQGVLVNRPGTPALGNGDFRLRTGKSVNVNIWFFMQKLNLVKHVVNLKYGLGLELNNYRYKSNISYIEGPTPFIIRDSLSFTKNKLAADYLTVPFMININTNPRSRRKGLSFSAGVSAGYLYSARNKQISGERGKDKNKDSYNLEKWKLAYIGEIGLGPIRLYGSYSITPLHEKGLRQYPYSVGLRLSNW
jgi:Outer membrane protein beta-barrel domain